jgi:hypothetical protein
MSAWSAWAGGERSWPNRVGGVPCSALCAAWKPIRPPFRDLRKRAVSRSPRITRPFWRIPRYTRSYWLRPTRCTPSRWNEPLPRRSTFLREAAGLDARRRHTQRRLGCRARAGAGNRSRAPLGTRRCANDARSPRGHIGETAAAGRQFQPRQIRHPHQRQLASIRRRGTRGRNDVQRRFTFSTSPRRSSARVKPPTPAAPPLPVTLPTGIQAVRWYDIVTAVPPTFRPDTLRFADRTVRKRRADGGPR